MATQVFAAAGQAIGAYVGGPVGAFIGRAIGTAIGAYIDSEIIAALSPGQEGPRLSDLRVTASTYGNAIPRVWGEEVRLAGNVIWSSGLQEHKHKQGGKGGPSSTTYSYTTSTGTVLADRAETFPIEDVTKIWANGKVIFDRSAATGAPTDVFDTDGSLISRTWTRSASAQAIMDSLTIYGGGFNQDPDPVIEAVLGVGQAPGYHGAAYVVIENLQLADFGNGLPNLEFLVVARTGETLAGVVGEVCDAAGIDSAHDISTSALVGIPLRGYAIGRPTSCWGAISPLLAAYNFDACEQVGQLRFLRRGMGMRATIPADQMDAHVFGDTPARAKFSRTTDLNLPREASLTFSDPARDFQANTQTERRSEGSADSNIAVDLPVTLTEAEGRAAAGRILWDAWTGRRALDFTLTDQWIGLQAGYTYGVPTASGVHPMRVISRNRGANGILELTAKADESHLYSYAPAGVSAPTPANAVKIPGPVNPPVILEPPSSLTGVDGAQVWIALSGGDGAAADPDWAGCSVYVSTDNSNFTLIGQVAAPAAQGKLTALLAAYGGANPDTAHTLSVSLAESGVAIASTTAAEAARALAPFYVGGEYMGIQTVTSTGLAAYNCTNLYRGLYGSAAGAHAIGAAFARLDDLVFKHELPAAYIGVTLYYRFPGKGETLAGVPSYTFTPAGTGFGGGAGGAPTTPTGLAGVTGGA